MLKALFPSSKEKASMESVLPSKKTTQKKIIRKTELTADDYTALTEIEHVLEKPGMYIGNVGKEKREEWVFDFQTKKMKKLDIDSPPALERLFLEIISNAGDNANRSREIGFSQEQIGMIEVMMDRKIISVKNGGSPIPIEFKEKEQLYVPELIFGTFRSGSNYNKEVARTGIGTNGLGAKLTNIYSKQFTVMVGDEKRKLKYTQVWKNNMKEKSAPFIEQHYQGPNFVHVIYELDLERLGYPEGYPDEIFHLFVRNTLDTGFSNHIPVSFNGEVFPVLSILDYYRLFFAEEKKFLIHYEYPPDTPTKTAPDGTIVSMDPSVIPILEVLVADTPDEARIISLVNGMITRDGGVHVQAVYKYISTYVLQDINNPTNTTTKSTTKSTKSTKATKSTEKREIVLTMADVKQHLSMLLSCRLEDSEFTSQSKTCLASPTPKISIPESRMEKMKSWELMDRLRAALAAKEFRNIAKSDGKKIRHLDLKKGFDANLAGSNRSRECTLYAVEGDSASSYVNVMLDFIENGKDKNGVFPFRGKLLNIMNAEAKQIAENKEIEGFKKILGLKEGLDYKEEANFNTLRYGKVILACDADVDAKHIIGLILNLFYCRFPSLLARGFVYFLRTPIIRAIKGKERIPFFTLRDYKKWIEEMGKEAEKYTYKHFKGLGSSETEDIEQDHKNKKVVSCLYDELAPQAMRLAFDDRMSNERKKWMMEANDIHDITDIKIMPISQFINEEFVQYSLSNLHRSIPRFMDGLKISQRKALHTAFHHWGLKKNAKHKELKVAQMKGKVAEITNYDHGEDNLDGVIISMAQNFCGNNNLPFFCRRGNFGSRFQGGQDAASGRYIFTELETWVPYIFREDDLPLLSPIIDEGMEVEPRQFLPILPMVLLNGASGIATGYSTFIPNYNPLDVIQWIRNKIQGKETPKLVPWYRGFTGTIAMREKRVRKRIAIDSAVLNKREKKEENGKEEIETGNDKYEDIEKIQKEEGFREEDGEEADETKKEAKVEYEIKMSFVTTGSYIWKKDGTVVIDELPIGKWTLPYVNYMKKLLLQKKLTDVRDLSKTDTVKIEIKGLDEPSVKKLHLEKSFGMGNMILLDDNNIPRKYDSAEHILEVFYQERLPYFDKRRLHILKELEEEKLHLMNKIHFISAIKSGKLKVNDIPLEQVHEQMKQMNLPEELLGKINIKNLTKTDTTILEEKCRKIDSDIHYYNTVSPSTLWLQDLDEFEQHYKKHYH